MFSVTDMLIYLTKIRPLVWSTKDELYVIKIVLLIFKYKFNDIVSRTYI
jgi:hypothetical protein